LLEQIAPPEWALLLLKIELLTVTEYVFVLIAPPSWIAALFSNTQFEKDIYYIQ